MSEEGKKAARASLQAEYYDLIELSEILNGESPDFEKAKTVLKRRGRSAIDFSPQRLEQLKKGTEAKIKRLEKFLGIDKNP